MKEIVKMIREQTGLVCYWIEPVDCFKKGYKQAIVDGFNLVEYTDNFVVYSITAYNR